MIVWLVPPAGVLLSRMDTNDLAYQIRAGALMVHHRQILRTDPFTFTVGGKAWLDQQWGSQVILDLLHRVAGWPGLIVVRAALVSIAFGVTYVWARRATGDALMAACLTVGALLVSISLPGALALRPQLLVVPLFLVALWIVRSRANHPRRLSWLPLMALVWANMHGSFVLLALVVGIAFVADVVGHAPSRRWTGLALLACLLTPVVNPWGPGIYSYVVRVSTSPIVRNVIDEWLPLWRRAPAGPLFLLAVVAVCLMLARRRRRLPTLEETLGLIAFTLLAITSGRNLLWWSLYVPPVLGGLVVARPERTADRSPLGFAMVGLLVGLLVAGCVHVATAEPPESLLAGAPQGITTALGDAAGSGGRVFDGWWGSWFEYALPEIPMFDDARAEIFPTSVWDDYFRISAARSGWMETLDRWRIEVVVASSDHQGPLIDRLERDRAWRETYRDAEGAVFVRRS
ncbi:MAG: hypothetical protein ACXVEI_11790 [Actinomycetota bacterium]